MRRLCWYCRPIIFFTLLLPMIEMILRRTQQPCYPSFVIIIMNLYRTFETYFLFRFVDEYWKYTQEELSDDENHLLRLLIIELSNLPSFVLEHLLLLIEKNQDINKELLLFYFEIINTLKEQNQLSEIIGSNCISFIISLPISIHFYI